MCVLPVSVSTRQEVMIKFVFEVLIKKTKKNLEKWNESIVFVEVVVSFSESRCVFLEAISEIHFAESQPN